MPNVWVTSQKQLHPSSEATQRIGKVVVLLQGFVEFKLLQAEYCNVGKPLASHNFLSTNVYVCP